jgi:hypothetical protein
VVDLGRLEERADSERDRLRTRLTEACERLSPGVTPSRLVRELLRDHLGEEGIYAAARETIDEATAFVIDNDLRSRHPSGDDDRGRRHGAF